VNTVFVNVTVFDWEIPERYKTLKVEEYDK
jgi:hypothetical protein